jgi:hypothetical protein
MSNSPAILPDYTVPADLAAHLCVSERTVRALARGLGAYRLIGNKMIMLKDDVETILEATRPCHSKSTVAAKSGTIAAPSPSGDYAALQAQRTKQSPKGSRQKQKPQSGVVTLMDRGRM